MQEIADLRSQIASQTSLPSTSTEPLPSTSASGVPSNFSLQLSDDDMDDMDHMDIDDEGQCVSNETLDKTIDFPDLTDDIEKADFIFD